MCVNFAALKVSCHLRDQSHSAYTSFCNVSMSSSVCTYLYALVSSVNILIELMISVSTSYCIPQCVRLIAGVIRHIIDE